MKKSILAFIILIILAAALIAAQTRAFAAGEPVRLAETGVLYDTLEEAVAAANGLPAATLEIIGDIGAVSANILIDSDITINRAGAAYSINLGGRSVIVRPGGKLTLGDGDPSVPLSIYGDGNIVSVGGGGTLDVRDGVELTSSGSYALFMSGAGATGNISGGKFTATNTDGSLRGVALHAENGAAIGEISGGEFIGVTSSAFITDPGTKIGKISGGRFIKTDASIDRSAFYVEHQSRIGEICGGYFEGNDINALMLIRGGWVDEISGGEFVVRNRTLTNRAGIMLFSGGIPDTGIGVFSGGRTTGGYLGIWLYGAGSRIDSITGGDIGGTRGLQIEADCVVNSITGGYINSDVSYGLFNYGYIGLFGGQAEVATSNSFAFYNYSYGTNVGRVDVINGGKITGYSYGLLNQSSIGEIGGDVTITGQIWYGLYNYYSPPGKIDKISGGTIVSGESNGIHNLGEIGEISGGTVIGKLSAVHCGLPGAFYTGKLDVISGGLFWGMSEAAIKPVYPLSLEPGLTNQKKGYGRYWGMDGAVFSDDSLAEVLPRYKMSAYAEPVPGIDEMQFKFLTDQHSVVVSNSAAGDPGAGLYSPGETVTIDAGGRIGCNFAYWETEDGVVFGDALSSCTTFEMPDYDVAVKAVWELMHEMREVTVNDSYAGAESGAGAYAEFETVVIKAGTRAGFTFDGWTVESGDPALADAAEPTTSFIMTAENIAVTANWRQIIIDSYSVTVFGSYYDADGTDGDDGGARRASGFSAGGSGIAGSGRGRGGNGAGVYFVGEIVTVRAGARAGYVFSGWTSDTGEADLANAGNSTTSFGMPARNVAVTANWKPAGGGGGGDGGSGSGNSGGGSGGGNDNTNYNAIEPIAPPTVEEAVTAGSNMVRVSKALYDGAGDAAGSGLDFIVVLYEKTANGWDKAGEYAVKANAGYVAIPNLSGGKTYQLVEKTGGWYNVRGYKLMSGADVIGAADGSSVAFGFPAQSQDMATDITVINEMTGEPDGAAPGGGEPAEKPPEFEFLETDAPLSPFITEHLAYIAGYPDGGAGPARKITRAEVASIFYRLLNDGVRDIYWTRENAFPDVREDMWFNAAVSVMANMDVLKGGIAGTFLPDDPITRAEFAAITARFARLMQMAPVNSLTFSDTAGHWAEGDIEYAAAIGWVSGFPDGTFRPEHSITRAEVIGLVNRMLRRTPETAGDLLDAKMLKWPDNADTETWFYLAVQEATNSHLPEYKDRFVPGQRYTYEYWLAMTPNPDWAALEARWAEGR